MVLQCLLRRAEPRRMDRNYGRRLLTPTRREKRLALDVEEMGVSEVAEEWSHSDGAI